MEKEILSLVKECRKVLSDKKSEYSLVSNCYYLKNNNILAMRNPYGDSRYPYSIEGLTMWVYASGNIVINESNFFISPLTVEGKEPYINFYGGIKNKKGQYDYFSITGNADSEFGLKQETYVIFNKQYAYFIRVIKHLYFAVKLTISSDKKIIISTSVINKSKKDIDAYISFYFNPLINHDAFENEETKWFKTVEFKGDKVLFTSVEDISREIHLYNYALVCNKNNGEQKEFTSRRMDYVGDKNRSISQSTYLKEGKFETSLSSASFVDMAIYGDIIKKHLGADDKLTNNYQISLSFNKEEADAMLKEKYDITDNDKYFAKQIDNTKNIEISFGPFKKYQNLNKDLFNKFVKSVIDQVNYCSKTKNSSLKLLGIRDVYQMMEASLLWDPKLVRTRILESLSYIDISGRAPRQYAKETKGSNPLFDNREFIDQGEWIITTIYKYLAFTNDYSLLKEKCGYCRLIDKNSGEKLDKKETVYQHLKRIINYLISNIDPKTNCLRALYGDWNDSVDGLGSSDDLNSKFGNGVSIMASCHLYENLIEMFEIEKQYEGIENPIYLTIKDKLEKGIVDNGIVDQRIVHGWGNNRSFYVGSKDDVDHKNRTSSTSHSFFVLSGLYHKHQETKDYILKAYDALDSKYGLKTFDEYFDKETASKVGRIVNLPKGTAENAAVYIHAGMFFVRALLQMGEGEKAFDQIYKLIPITHLKITTSPFVMPNSYGENLTLGIDGESMSDWYTGSSNTFIKAMVYDMFGVNPHLDNSLSINPTSYFPSEEAYLSLNIKKHKVIIKYKDSHIGSRHIYVNGELLDCNLINLDNYDKHINIEIID